MSPRARTFNADAPPCTPESGAERTAVGTASTRAVNIVAKCMAVRVAAARVHVEKDEWGR